MKKDMTDKKKWEQTKKIKKEKQQIEQAKLKIEQAKLKKWFDSDVKKPKMKLIKKEEVHERLRDI
jgi:ribosome-associated toxin RatA of RatAB toxin-antitoxin module